MQYRDYRYPTKRPKWTFILAGVCIFVFILQIIYPYWKDFAFVPAYAFERPWTFVTSIFFHADFSHLFFNMFALFIFGIYLESRIETRDFLLIFFLAGIVGNIGYMVTASDPLTPGIGASGAIYGVMGSLAILTPFAMIYAGYIPMPMIAAAFLWGVTEFLGLFVPGSIAHGAHIFGLFLGIAYGFYLRMQARKSVGRVPYFRY
jgi:hypothetical protein